MAIESSFLNLKWFKKKIEFFFLRLFCKPLRLHCLLADFSLVDHGSLLSLNVVFSTTKTMIE